LAERNGTFASTFIEKLQQASSDDRILHRLCQYALHPAHQQHLDGCKNRSQRQRLQLRLTYSASSRQAPPLRKIAGDTPATTVARQLHAAETAAATPHSILGLVKNGRSDRRLRSALEYFPNPGEIAERSPSTGPAPQRTQDSGRL